MSLDALFHVMCAQLGHRLREAGILSPRISDTELVQVRATIRLYDPVKDCSKLLHEYFFDLASVLQSYKCCLVLLFRLKW